MGWYMVKSGLSEALMKEPGAVPRVSQYRLTAHLATAVAIYGSTIFVAADILRQNKIASGQYPASTAAMLNNPVLKRFRIASHSLGSLILLTLLSGGLVAGLDAGLIYNEYPWMGEGIVPPKDELWSDNYVKPNDGGKWRNFFENPKPNNPTALNKEEKTSIHFLEYLSANEPSATHSITSGVV